MADVFISYSKADRPLVERLEAALNAAGFTTWWDRGLTPGDDFGPVIDRHLAEARAVVCVWTETSVKSQWVRAEAVKANTAGKLVPVKTAAIAYEQIPPPFNVLDTGHVEDTVRLVEAVKALLAKPAVEPGRWFLARAKTRQELLSWSWVIGAAVTTTANLQGIIGAVRWLQWLLDNWLSAITWFWGKLLFFLPKPHLLDASLLTVSAFLLLNVAASTRAEKPRNSRLSSLASIVVASLIVSAVYLAAVTRALGETDPRLMSSAAMRITQGARDAMAGILEAHEALAGYPYLYDLTGLALTVLVYLAPITVIGLFVTLIGAAIPFAAKRWIDTRLLLSRLLRIVAGIALLAALGWGYDSVERSLLVR